MDKMMIIGWVAVIGTSLFVGYGSWWVVMFMRRHIQILRQEEKRRLVGMVADDHAVRQAEREDQKRAKEHQDAMARMDGVIREFLAEQKKRSDTMRMELETMVSEQVRPLTESVSATREMSSVMAKSHASVRLSIDDLKTTLDEINNKLSRLETSPAADLGPVLQGIAARIDELPGRLPSIMELQDFVQHVESSARAKAPEDSGRSAATDEMRAKLDVLIRDQQSASVSQMGAITGQQAVLASIVAILNALQSQVSRPPTRAPGVDDARSVQPPVGPVAEPAPAAVRVHPVVPDASIQTPPAVPAKPAPDLGQPKQGTQGDALRQSAAAPISNDRVVAPATPAEEQQGRTVGTAHMDLHQNDDVPPEREPTHAAAAVEESGSESDDVLEEHAQPGAGTVISHAEAPTCTYDEASPTTTASADPPAMTGRLSDIRPASADAAGSVTGDPATKRALEFDTKAMAQVGADEKAMSPIDVPLTPQPMSDFLQHLQSSNSRR